MQFLICIYGNIKIYNFNYKSRQTYLSKRDLYENYKFEHQPTYAIHSVRTLILRNSKTFTRCSIT